MLLWMDGFDAYGTNDQYVGSTMKSALYVAAQCYANNSTRTGRGYCIRFGQNSGGSDEIRKAFETRNEVVVGFAWKTDRINVLRNICEFRYDNQFGSVWRQFGVWMAGDGAVSCGYFDQNDNAQKLFDSGPNILFPGVWHFIEIKLKLGDSNGFIQVKIDGQTCISGNGRTKNPNAPVAVNVLRSGNYYLEDITNNQVYLDDLYICDTQGAAFNDFLGDVVVHTVMPTQDAGPNQASQFGGGIGHYTSVSEIPPDNDTSYLYSNTAGAQELFSVDRLPPNVIDVLAVSVHTRVKKDAAGASNIKMLCSSGGSLAKSDVQAVATQYVTRSAIFPAAPDGGGWTKAKAEGMKIGFEVA